jgi:uncharacterized protein YidB (DUF937 family)
MGLLDELVGKATNVFGGEAGSGGALEGVMGMLTSGEGGGLSGLVQSFRDKGLGDLISSWVSAGQNLPISADQIQHALGSEQIQRLASQAGLSSVNLSAMLSEHLPGLIDKLTPDGVIPEGGLLTKGLVFLKERIS